MPRPASMKTPFPAPTPLQACIDSEKVVARELESNNCVTAAGTVTVMGLPLSPADLAVTSADAAAGNALAGRAVPADGHRRESRHGVRALHHEQVLSRGRRVNPSQEEPQGCAGCRSARDGRAPMRRAMTVAGLPGHRSGQLFPPGLRGWRKAAPRDQRRRQLLHLAGHGDHRAAGARPRRDEASAIPPRRANPGKSFSVTDDGEERRTGQLRRLPRQVLPRVDGRCDDPASTWTAPRTCRRSPRMRPPSSTRAPQ